jgi:integrase
MRDAGVKHYSYDGRSAHSLRHTALTDLAESSGDAFLVQELAGWSSPHCARRASTERLREALAKRDEVDHE